MNERRSQTINCQGKWYSTLSLEVRYWTSSSCIRWVIPWTIHEDFSWGEESADMFDYSEVFEHWNSVRNRYFVKNSSRSYIILLLNLENLYEHLLYYNQLFSYVLKWKPLNFDSSPGFSNQKVLSDFLEGHPTKSGILKKDWEVLNWIIFLTEKLKKFKLFHHLATVFLDLLAFLEIW